MVVPVLLASSALQVNPCAGAPTISSISQAIDDKGCPDGTDWNLTWALSGSLGSHWVVEVWRKEWEDAESEPGSFSYLAGSRGATSVFTYSDELAASDGLGTTITYHKRAELRVVPVESAEGSGDVTCESDNVTDSSATINECTV